MARKTNKTIDGRSISAFKERAKKRGGRTIEQQPIMKWADQAEGFILQGLFVRVREGKKRAGSKMEPGHLLDIADLETGEIRTWGCPAILHSRIEQNGVKEGDELEIMFIGTVENQYGNESRDFVVNHYPKRED